MRRDGSRFSTLPGGKHAGLAARIADSPRRAAPMPRRWCAAARAEVCVHGARPRPRHAGGAATRRALPALRFTNGLPIAAAPPLRPRHHRTARRPHPRPPHTRQAAHDRLSPAARPGCWPFALLVSMRAQAAQLLGGLAVRIDARSGRTPAARPPALSARGRAGRRRSQPRQIHTRAHLVAFLQRRRARARPARCFSAATVFCSAGRRSSASRGRPPPSPLPCTLPPNPRRAASRPPRGMRKRLKQGRGAGLAVPVRHWRHGLPRWAGLGCVLPRRVYLRIVSGASACALRLPRAAPRSCARGPPV